MDQEIELTVTIVYGGTKRHIATPEGALPIIRQGTHVSRQLLGIPHPKRVNVMVVCRGTVRFFWTALPNSAIHKTLSTVISTIYSEVTHRALLARLMIEAITLRESPAPLDAQVPLPPMPKAPAWKPPHEPRYPDVDVGLYATPMSASASAAHRSFSSSAPGPGRSQHQPEEASRFLEQIASGDAPRTADSAGHVSWDRVPPPPINVKSEPIVDVPIPPPSHRPHYDVDDEMQTDSPRRSSTSASLRIDRNCYATIPDPSPRPAPTPEVRALQRELRDVRTQLAAELDKERALLQKLRELGADDELAATPGSDFVTKARMQQLEGELREERATRRRLEGVLGDVRRECRAPFVVPALLNAFVEVSRLTSQALEEG
ncbi:hypothetical protein B0H17DRAFT_1193261 [Mycena rosella]|uniref:Uncharacterized protein n=1 Tax=Mycena rosella TaxID=1033263 RepID=A0AAD7GUH8_MYCRO|nr:hypothetical protein B0H17DRAFT_1193261 [Mycena rosella]